MSLSVRLVLKPKVPRAKCKHSGEALGNALEPLATLAEQRQITPITAFMDLRQPPERFDGDPDDLLDLLGPWIDWFPAADGVAAMTESIDLLKKDEKAAAQLDEPAAVIEELADVLRVLEVAAKAGARFRFEIV